MKKKLYIFILLVFNILQLNGQEYKLIIQPDLDILKSYQDIKGDSMLIQNRLKQLIIELQDKGYAAASVDQLSYDTSGVIARIFVGKKYYRGKLNFKLNNEDLDKINIKWKEDKVLNLRELQNVRLKILQYYENSGYPFAQVLLDNIEFNDTLFEADILVDTGDYYQLDSIIVKGEAKVRLNYLEKVLQTKSGMPFNQAKINSISKKITDVSFLNEIKPAEIEFSDRDFDLYLYLKNRKANTFNGIIGFLPENEKTNNLLITGELSLNLFNSFKSGEEIYLHWEKLESSTQNLDVGFTYPYLFKTNLGLDADFGLYKKDSTYLSLKADLGLRLFLSYDDYIKAYYRYKSTSRIGEEETYTNSLNLADVKSNIFGASYYLNEVDYKYNPAKGIELEVFAGAGFKSVESNKKLTDSLSIDPDNKTIEIEAGLDLDLYFPVYGNFVFHFGNTSRYLDQFTDSNKDNVLFENELYRFGGARTLRGFDENIFYASIYSLQNIEIKYLFEQNSSFYIFWNGAYYYKDVTNSVTEDFPWGFGIGMDFETKAGIFSLSYALGKQFENPIEIRTAKIHFGYISRF